MLAKPKHLSLTYAKQFKEQSVVAAYVHRPPISAPVFDLLLQLLFDLIPRDLTNRDFVSYDLVDELTNRQLFRRQGTYATPPIPFQQSIADYVEAIHSRNGFSRERMTPENALAFDEAVTEILTPAYPDGMVRIEVIDHIVWGEPGPID